MSESTIVLINQIIMMFIIMMLGLVLYKIKWIDASGAAQMADVVIYVSTPCLTVQSLFVAFDPEVLVNALFCFLVTFIIMLVSIVLAHGVFRKPESGLARYGVVFSNCGFIGIPLVRSVLGPEMVFQLTASNLASTILVWTYGVLQISGDKSQVAVKNILLNPAIFSLFIGLACFFTGFRFPEPVTMAIDGLGDINTGLVMLVLGTYLGQVDFQRLIVQPRMYQVSALRLIVVPLFSVGVMMLFPMVDASVRLTVVIAIAAPAAALTAVFAKKYGKDSELGVGLVAFTTLLSMVTMPVILSLALAVI